MPLYAVHLRTHGEEKYIQIADRTLQDTGIKFFWLRRALKLRRKGKWINNIAPIFPGYIFLESMEVSSYLYYKLKGIPGFYQFLKSDHNITPLCRNDREILNHFLTFGEIVDKSIVVFDENNRIKVVSGPLIGLDGLIVKVDRRKGRAKVRLDLYNKSILIDFGFEALERMVE